MLAVGAMFFGTTQLIPLLLQGVGYTATLSGLSLMPGGFAMLMLMPIAGRVGSSVSLLRLSDHGRRGRWSPWRCGT